MKNGTSLEQAIAKEREMLQPLRERAITCFPPADCAPRSFARV